MNRFRTKKKAKDDLSAPRPSTDSDSSSGFRFRKGKKVVEEPKPEFNIAEALPSSDDFRTSLLMTGLSARFSMLREQDDPNTKIGKASDDSVLFPKRQSRMDFSTFGGGISGSGLHDIAEVESIKAAPPFARINSFNSSDDAESTHGSIMSRAKPTEGNNLFGGRQKIYKIPAGAESSRTVGGMSGRALYDDDVALSAFQKWKKAEKERKSLEGPDENTSRRPSTEEPEARPQSPFSSNYNQKRETSSTVSSMPSIARNSTAATSVTSQQPTPSLKEWQSSSTAPTSANSTPSLERSFTRTRRLYETGLNHDLHEQQTSALSRIDTLTRQRTLGSRTPDLSQNSPSPTTFGFMERFGERRILAKGSAPNLRSRSPPTAGPSADAADMGIRVASAGENRPNFGGAPPLSPPISETDEVSNLPIQPSDRGKATALGVFHKPAQPYDESRYAQRQLQLQQGRETPTHRFRTGSNASFAVPGSRSASPIRQQSFEGKMEISHHQSPLQAEARSSRFLDDSDAAHTVTSHAAGSLSSQVAIPRPSDRDHPAFRDSSMPTPLSMVFKSSGEPSPTGNLSKPGSPKAAAAPSDSPTLGPTLGSSGLSGMVRQHLRHDSGASSIYGGGPLTSGLESRFPSDIPIDEETTTLQDLAAKLNPWDPQSPGQDWSSPYGSESTADKRARSSTMPAPDRDINIPIASRAEPQETDEFASQLAESRRRIREKLTSYVESDSGRSTPPPPLPFNDSREALNSIPSPRHNALGLLRSKTSRGSMVERSQPGSKSMKILGLNGAVNQPIAYRYPAETPSSHSRMKDDVAKNNSFDAADNSGRTNGEEEQHAGVQAFRQARRDLQKMREVESEQKHHPVSHFAEGAPPRMSPKKEAGMRTRTPSGDRKPPPVFYNTQRDRSSSRSGSRRPSMQDERDRSGSMSSGERSLSSGGRSGSRPPPVRPRNGSSPPGDAMVGPNGHPAGSMLRSPGLPGTNIRRSPIMPPQGYPYGPGSPARTNQANYGSNHNLHVQHGRPYEPGQPSPISPLPSSFLLSGPSTPGALPSPQRPPAVPTPGNINSDGTEVPGLSDAMKRTVKKKDISEPTFVMSTSRVPTVPLPPTAAANRSRSSSRSRSNSKAESHGAPPLPPINPRRRRESSKSRGMFGMGGHRDDDMASASTPNLLANIAHMADPSEESRSTFSISDDEDPKPNRRRLRKMPADAPDMASRMRAVSNSPAYHAGPPASRMVVTQGRRPMPGGMI